MDERPFNELGWRTTRLPGLQLAGRPRIVSEVQYGGHDEDRRLFMSVEELRMLLARAEASVTQRVVMHGVGLRVQTLEASGHRYQAVKLTCRELVSEMDPMGIIR